jgi:hypothetical protein
LQGVNSVARELGLSVWLVIDVRPADKFSRRDLPCCGGSEKHTQAGGDRGEPQGRARKGMVQRGRRCLLAPPLDLSPPFAVASQYHLGAVKFAEAPRWTSQTVP